jgi:hypothetical protein
VTRIAFDKVNSFSYTYVSVALPAFENMQTKSTKTKKPGQWPGFIKTILNKTYAPTPATRLVKREILRDTVLRCITPLDAPRASSGWAACIAASAALLSPDAIASSTLRTKVRIREMRDLLISVRAAILRVAFLADEVLAINASVGYACSLNCLRAKIMGRPMGRLT